jgi:hypothetical protein
MESIRIRKELLMQTLLPTQSPGWIKQKIQDFGLGDMFSLPANERPQEGDARLSQTVIDLHVAHHPFLHTPGYVMNQITLCALARLWSNWCEKVSPSSPHVATPTILSPVNSATNVKEQPIIQSSAFAVVGGTDTHAASEWRVRKATGDWATPLWDSGADTVNLTSVTLPAGILQAGQQSYVVQVRHKGTAYGWSEWSENITFTTSPSFVHVATPSIVSPANNATNIDEQPTIQSSAFAVVGGSDTHAASQWRIREASGTWEAPLWDSGADASNLLSILVPSGLLQDGGKSYFVQTRQKGTALGWSEWSPEVGFTTKAVFANVVGVVRTAASTGRLWDYVDADGKTITPTAADFAAHPVWSGIQDVTIDGQSMVKVPSFYVKRGTIAAGVNTGLEAWWISDVAMDGFHIHPAFRSANADLDCIYIGKYQASVSGTKLASVAGVMPAVSRSLSECQALATARNASGVTGFMLWSIYHVSAIQWLYLVEYATMDSQTKSGLGRTSTTSFTTVDDTTVAQATYRGIVGLWGNIYQWIDGVKTISGVVNIWDNNGNKTFVPTEKSPTTAPNYTYPIQFLSDKGNGFDFSDVFIMSSGVRDDPSSAISPDAQYYSNVGTLYPASGGYYALAGQAGLWHMFSYSSPAPDPAPQFIGSRLVKE